MFFNPDLTPLYQRMKQIVIIQVFHISSHRCEPQTDAFVKKLFLSEGDREREEESKFYVEAV